MKTTKDFDYCAAPYGHIAIIPAGTSVQKANNLPEKDGKPQYWSKGWRGMNKYQRSWKDNYGFLLTHDEVKGI